MNLKIIKCYGNKYISLKIISLNVKLNKNEDLDNTLKERLIAFRKIRSNEMKIPAYYVFTNEEFDKLVELKPKTIEQLKKSNILSPIKIKTHGNEIINEINK